MTDDVSIVLAKANVVLYARRLRAGTATVEDLLAQVDALNAELAKAKDAREAAR